MATYVQEAFGTFLIGTEGGVIFKGFMHHNEAMMKEFEGQQKESEGWRAAQRKLISPLKSEYEGHLGSVQGVDSSPFHRNVFASCGSDGSIHLYSMLHTKVQMFLEPVRKNLTCIRWSPFRPLVLIC